MAGLRPAHFVSMACPHLGCRGTGAAQIPFMGWFSAVPLIGRSMQQASAQACYNSGLLLWVLTLKVGLVAREQPGLEPWPLSLPALSGLGSRSHCSDLAWLSSGQLRCSVAGLILMVRLVNGSSGLAAQSGLCR